jgi:hypothetical protein
MRILPLTAVALSLCASGAAPAIASAPPAPLDSSALNRAQVIRYQVDGRYRGMTGARLDVREATATNGVESFTLLTSDLQHARIVSADNGIYYAICVVDGPCHAPHPRRAHRSGALLPRRIALELALRTFLETSADVVAVSLPTRFSTLVVIARDEATRDINLVRFANALRRDPVRGSASWSRPVIDLTTRPRVFTVIGLEPTPSGRETLAAIPRWPDDIGEASE